jgi:dihydroorotase
MSLVDIVPRPPVVCDVILSGARIIDPATGTDAIGDVAIAGDKIAAVGAALTPAGPAKRVDLTGLTLTPGFIDTHAHVYEHVTGDFGLNPDLVGVRSGVTTVVDLGGASALTIAGFEKFVVEPARTRVLSYISTYLAGGLFGHIYVGLYGPSGIDVKAVVAAGHANPGLIRGVKAHAEAGGYSRWGLEALRLGKRAAKELGIPLYVHLGTLWPEVAGSAVDPAAIIDEVVPLLEAGDVLAHPYTRFPSGFVNDTGEVHPLVYKAIEKGVLIDVGRGGHFSFENAFKVVKAGGVTPYTLGSDLHGYNVKFPDGTRWNRGVFPEIDGIEPLLEANPAAFVAPYGLYHLITEMMALGFALPDLVAMVTSNAATLLRMDDEIGALRPGMVADISIFRELSGSWTLRDSMNGEAPATKLIHPEMVMRAGEFVVLDSPLLPTLDQLAA